MKRTSPPSVAVQQKFLFVATEEAKSSKEGRRDARSYVMRNARRERPWSTSKHAAKQRRSPKSTSPTKIYTPNLSTTPINCTPSPPNSYFGPETPLPVVPRNSLMVKEEPCADCQFLRYRPGLHLCSRCMLFQPDNNIFDPFETTPVKMTPRVSMLLKHCEFGPVSTVRDLEFLIENTELATCCRW